MQNILTQFAEAEAEGGDLFGTLGIDWTALLLQTISFIILVIILAKWIYPPIAAMLDRHDKKIEDAMKAAEDAQKHASESEAKTAELLEQSRIDAAGIIEAAKVEAAEIVSKAEEDATTKAEVIVSNARADLERDVEQARAALRGEMVDLVALATEKIIDTKIDAADEKIINSVIEEHK
ncbi:MAG: F0F1 ATP synthase subunit B [Candidatus Saccharibacteria bacterium]|nr:F0F1 ATP synthase subunit B [Candidatus Saccharibacteria bacterium]